MCLMPYVASGKWETITQAPLAYIDAGQAILNNKLYLIGGAVNFVDDAIRVLNLNDVSSGWETVGKLSRPRTALFAAGVKEKIFIIGGSESDANGSNDALATSVLAFDPVSKTIESGASIPIPVTFFSAVVIKDKIYVLGGGAEDGITKAVQIYDVVDDTWSQGTDMPVGLILHAAAAIEDTIYVIAGYQSQQKPISNTTYKGVVNGTQITWTKVADYPINLNSAAAGVAGGRVIVAAGTSTSFRTSKTVYAYDPKTNSWQAEESLPSNASDVYHLPSDGTALYYVAGFNNAGIYKYTAPTNNPALLVDENGVLVTLISQEQQTTTFKLNNIGLAPLSYSSKITTATSWVSIKNPSSGSVPPTNAASVDLLFNAGSLSNGTYKTELEITSNDPQQSVKKVPIQLHVTAKKERQPAQVLIEEGSGDWCQFCPDGHDKLKEIQSKYGAKVAILSYHGGSATEPLAIPDGEDILNRLGLTSWPSAAFNRRALPENDNKLMSFDRSTWEPSVASLLQQQPTAPVALFVDNYFYDNKALSVTAKVRVVIDEATRVQANSTLRLTVAVKEDDILLAQTYPAGIVVGSYLQPDVVRIIYPSPDGLPLALESDRVENGIMLPNTTIEQDISFELPNSLLDSKTHLVFFVHSSKATGVGEVLQSYTVPLTGLSTTGIGDQQRDQSNHTTAIVADATVGVTYFPYDAAQLGDIEMNVYSVDGSLVWRRHVEVKQTGHQRLMIETAMLPAGIYLVVAKQTGKAPVTCRMLVPPSMNR